LQKCTSGSMRVAIATWSFFASCCMMAAICSADLPAPKTTSGKPVRCALQLSTCAKSSTCDDHQNDRRIACHDKPVHPAKRFARIPTCFRRRYKASTLLLYKPEDDSSNERVLPAGNPRCALAAAWLRPLAAGDQIVPPLGGKGR
jgi:hypothetical protein